MKVETTCRVGVAGGGWVAGAWRGACVSPRPHHKHCIDGEIEAREQLDWSCGPAQFVGSKAV